MCYVKINQAKSKDCQSARQSVQLLKMIMNLIQGVDIFTYTIFSLPKLRKMFVYSISLAHDWTGRNFISDHVIKNEV